MIEMSTIQVVLGMVLVLLMHVFNVLALRSRSPRGKLHRQGIHGPSPHFYFGNIPEMKTLLLQVQSAPTTQVKDKDQHVSLSHKWPFTLFPHIQKSLILVFYWDYTVANGDRYKNGEGNHHVYLFGFREAYLFVQRSGTTLGPRHIVSKWANLAHQRKIIAPELYLDKEMVNLIVDATNITQRSWEARPERKEIFSKLRDLQKLLSKIHAGIPGFRNRQMWRLEKELNSKISKLIKHHQKETHEHDLLQMILEGAKNCTGSSDGLLSNSMSHDRFVIDNCKNILFAGHETIAITASWCLMLLAAHQDWQDCARAVVLEVCGRGALDASMRRSLKTVFYTLYVLKLNVSMKCIRIISP
ncbi:Cytochrome P450 734A1 [Glycine soja]|uniref:Cytochrome P450 734A1 n=1 Tax=Glycine soja TaxID=3848 RepID=A0A0B2R976_GLYSO|nr:Cytochrome P450 734A1 [Glycine soja]